MGSRSKNTFRFTKDAIDALPKPERGEAVYFDSETRGLAVRVWATGAKTFAFYMRVGRKVVRRSIAPATGSDAINVATARKEADTIREALKAGRSLEPAKPAGPGPAAPTLGSAFAKFIRAQKTENRTWRDDVSRFRKYLKAHARKPLAEADADWLTALHARITREGHPGAANRLMSMMSDMFHVAMRLPRIAPTPVSMVPRNPETERARTLKVEEERRLLPAIDAYEAEPIRVSGNAGTDPDLWPDYRKPKDPERWPAHMRPKTPEAMEAARAKQRAKMEAMRERWRVNLTRKTERARRNRTTEADLIRVLYWTGQRAGEVRAMEWAEVDFDARTWTIPALKYKTDAPHVCTLTADAITILQRRRAQAEPGERYVFPAGNSKSGRGYYCNYHRAWARIKELAGIDLGVLKPKDRLRCHDLRAAFCTAMADDGATMKDIQESVGHRNPKTTLRYIRRSAAQRAQAVERMSEARRQRLGLSKAEEDAA